MNSKNNFWNSNERSYAYYIFVEIEDTRVELDYNTQIQMVFKT